MRLTGGFLKGRKLFYRKTPVLRPTRNIVREAIFDILGEDIQGSRIIEIFAGTGALGFEALSRGAISVIFVDNSWQSIKLLEKNCRILDLTEKIKIINMDAEQALKKIHKKGFIFDIIFADPPYKIDESKMERIFLLASKILREDGFFILETSSKKDTFKNLKNLFLELKRDRKYGSTNIRIYQKERASCCISGQF